MKLARPLIATSSSLKSAFARRFSRWLIAGTIIIPCPGTPDVSIDETRREHALSEREWRVLFDGATLDGWFSTGFTGDWTVTDECIALENPRGGSFLCTEEYFENFDFTFEYRHEPNCNSGIYFRWSELTDRQTGMEIQILDTHNRDDVDPRHECGALYDMAPAEVGATKPAGEWNRMRLTCDGPTIGAELNGETTVDVDITEWDTPGENPDGTENKFTDYAMRDLPRRGRIGLQDHGGRVRFRDLRVRER